MVAPVLPPAGLERLRAAIAEYTVDAVQDRLGPAGQSALARGDVLGARRSLPPAARDERVGALTWVLVLGGELTARQAAAAVAPLDLDAAVAAGLLEYSAGAVRAGLDLRPYAEDTSALPSASGGAATAPSGWWVVSDLGTDLRPGPLRADHVLGVGAASLTLAQATPRPDVATALDLGTGCGVQALHLGRHAGRVTATDVSARALALAATTAALSGERWDLRAGSLLEPVVGDRFDLVVANPPFVVSPAPLPADGVAERYDYRDSGLYGDEVSRQLVRGLPSVLSPGGTAQLLANWVVTADQTWDERVGSWLDGLPCDAWVWQRELAEPGEYVELWLRDAGEQPGTARWQQRYTAWRDGFERAGVLGIGMGLITLWATDGLPVQVLEDVPQAVAPPVGPHVAAWPAVQRRLAGLDDAALLALPLRARADVQRVVEQQVADDGWRPRGQRLRQLGGLRWDLEVDDAIAGLVAGCSGAVPLQVVTTLLADLLAAPAADVVAGVLPVVRDLVARGFLLLPDDAPGTGS